MSVSKKQREFTVCCAKLVLFADSKGYGLTTGDGYRDPRLHGEFGEDGGYGSKNSVHKKRLAQDYNLFIGDDYITDGDNPVYTELGEYWESLHEDARWGGRFKSVDSNHFSFELWGCK
ncbi:MAG: M15 family metallopeptidase [Candidatus Tenebribacter davisii]|nr:M15 family metallopeptidase [Candidatus Tenebribacter davisii]